MPYRDLHNDGSQVFTCFDPVSAGDDTHPAALCDYGIHSHKTNSHNLNLPDSTSKQAALNMVSDWFLND